MCGRNYPADWESRRREVLTRYLNRCVNCHRANEPLQVHHIVPVGRGGSHRTSNLVPLCSDCHTAIHEGNMAPRVRWFTNGKLSSDEFGEHKTLWKQMREQFGAPRYDSDEGCVYVPLADVDRVVKQMNA